jgi:SAM-dependent methyltransferase
MRVRKKCRICNHRLQKIISFKKISLVGNFFKNKGDSKKFPISLNFCKKCKHVQIAEIINPKKLFTDYLWQTSVSKTNFLIFNELIKQYKNLLTKKTKVLEIACNDGSFLKYLQKKFDCFLAGVDPAKNIFKENKKIKFLNSFFNVSSSKILSKKYGKFDIIFARNVLAHVTDPNEIFKGVKNLLSKKGIFVIEVPHLLPILKNLQYDNIFHEHQGFHSLKSISDLCKKNRLTVSNVKEINSQGGSIRCEIINEETNVKSKIKKFINYEFKNRLFNTKYLRSFKYRILSHNKAMYNFLYKLKNRNNKISVYGASGKGQALMQFCNINYKLIDKVYDKSNLKKGRFTPGTNIKINLSKHINRKNIDYMLLLSWNLKSEIINQEKVFLKKGGKFIIPFPKPRILKI